MPGSLCDRSFAHLTPTLRPERHAPSLRQGPRALGLGMLTNVILQVSETTLVLRLIGCHVRESFRVGRDNARPHTMGASQHSPGGSCRIRLDLPGADPRPSNAAPDRSRKRG